ncbi:hypothetical protein Tco_0697056 [Tanacetum coccineum]
MEGSLYFPHERGMNTIAVQVESKERTTLLQSIPNDHVANFHYMDDAMDIWNAVKASPPVLTEKMSYVKGPSYSSSTYTVPSNSKTGSQRSGNVIEDVLQSFVADTEPEQQLAYEDFDQIEKLDLEEMDLKWQMAMLSVRVHKFEQKARRKIDFDKKESARFNKKKEGKKEEDSKALITVDTLVDWTDHDGQSDGVIASKEFVMKVIGRPPLTRDYTPLSDHTDLDESQMTYGTKFSISGDSNSVSNDIVACENSDSAITSQLQILCHQ